MTVYRIPEDLMGVGMPPPQADILTALFQSYGPSGIDITDYLEVADGTDLKNAFTAAIAFIKSGDSQSRVLVVPYVAGGWTVSSQVLFDLSNFTLLLYGDIRLTATTPQRTLMFAYDTSEAPAHALTNVALYAPNGATVDGNGSNMSFAYYNGIPNYSSVRFNYVDGVNAYGVKATNGPIDSFSVRQCRNFNVRRCTFTTSKYDNGFSATTDWGTWVSGDISTWGYGTVEDCVAYGNMDFGMTAFNASGVWFKNCMSYGNDSGFSYEDSFGSPNVKDYQGGFATCYAFDNLSRGIYVTGDAVTIDDNCQTWNNRGTPFDNTGNLYESGVTISEVNRAYVGGLHRNNGRAGIALFNGSDQAMDITIGPVTIQSNDWNGIYGQGVGRLSIASGAQIIDNGLVQVASAYASGISIINSGTGQLVDQGVVSITGAIIDGSGLGAITADHVKTVNVQGCFGSENCAKASAYAVHVDHATDATIFNNNFSSTSGNQVFAVALEAGVLHGYDWGNIGTGTSGIVTNLASSKAQTVHNERFASASWTPGTVNAGAQATTTVSVPNSAAGDFASASFSISVGLLVMSAAVTSADTVTVYLTNYTASPIIIGAGTVRAKVIFRNPGNT